MMVIIVGGNGRDLVSGVTQMVVGHHLLRCSVVEFVKYINLILNVNSYPFLDYFKVLPLSINSGSH